MKPETTNNIDRRAFIGAMASAALATVPITLLLSGCATTGLVAYRQPIVRGRISLDVSQYPELQIDGGAIELTSDDLPEPIILVHKAAGEYLALSPVCTHLGCAVRKEPSVFRCPCHGSTYSLDGTVVRGPAEKSLARYRTEFKDGILTLQVR